MAGGFNTLKPLHPVELPHTLYHGSAFEAAQLRPGFCHNGTLRTWGFAPSRNSGGMETNHYLYATTDVRVATDCAALRALELSCWGLQESFQGESGLVLAFREPVAMQDLEALPAFVYLLRPRASDCWIRNQELADPLRDGQYRTRRTIEPVNRQAVQMATWLRNRRAVISTLHRKVA